MAIARSTQNVHGDGHGSGLSPTCIRVNCVEGRESSSIAMGQENVIALLLQQQEEVLKEIRDQNKVRYRQLQQLHLIDGAVVLLFSG